RRNHQVLQDAVARQGLVTSEYARGEPPVAYHFPERKRIIAGLSEVVLVVEAKKRSGSLITANLGLDENRSVCAIPGRIDAPLSVGRSEEHTSELQSRFDLVCRLLLEKKKYMRFIIDCVKY